MEPQRCDRLACPSPPSPPNLVGTGSRPSLKEIGDQRKVPDREDRAQKR